MNNIKLICLALAATTLLGCASSSAKKQQQLARKAEARAGILAAGLPVNYGALSIVNAHSKDANIILDMVYSQSTALSANQLFEKAKDTYCANESITESLEEGMNYQVRIRNSRGQMVVNQMITQNSCQ